MTAAMQVDPATFETVLADMHERLAEAGRRYQIKLHEAESLAAERDRFRAESQPQKIWPVHQLNIGHVNMSNSYEMQAAVRALFAQLKDALA
jgi:hypothetical protein